MLVEVKVPELAESVAEATLVSWLKKPGDAVEQGENLIEIETDKVMLEVSAPESGVLKEIKKNDNETVLSNEVIATIDTDGAGVVPITSQAKKEPEPAPPPVRARPEAEKVPPAAPAATQPAPKKKAEIAEPPSQPKPPKLSPAVRKLLEEHQLAPSDITSTGKEGRISKEDVLRFLASQQESKPVAESAPPVVQPQAEVTAPPTERGEKRVPMTRLRKRIAERLLAAQQENAILTTFNEVNMQPVMELRKRYRDKFEEVHGVRLGFMSFFVSASIQALKRFPVVNASIDGTDIVHPTYFDIGIAVSSPRGLVVPILRDADRLSLAEIERGIGDYARKAKENKLTIEELTGGTFTITNGGIFGSLLSTPILNPPQSAILGMHKIQLRPMAENGEVVIRPMMNLALSYDHRIIDGREAVQFLVTIKDMIEDPSRLLLHV